MNSEKIRSFTQLIAWQEGHRLAVVIYRITRYFPRDEQFGLISQMRRCSISVTSNIAEGFSRQSRKEKVQFDYTSLGSLTELQNQLLISRDVGYINDKDFQAIALRTLRVARLIQGLIKSADVKKELIPNTGY